MNTKELFIVYKNQSYTVSKDKVCLVLNKLLNKNLNADTDSKELFLLLQQCKLMDEFFLENINSL